MPETHIEYAWPHIRPLLAVAAAFTAQWQAALTSHARPCCMSSNAPRRCSTGAWSAPRTAAVVSPDVANIVTNS
jgi:hypothetical protein